jgi:hypothetical protein
VAVAPNASFAQETLEEQAMGNRIDGSDAERVADHTVGGTAAALDEDVLLTAEVTDIPNDQEIAAEA